MLSRNDLLAIAKLENCPDKVRFFTAMFRSNDYYFLLHVIGATKGFNRDEWKEMGPLLLEILERDNVSQYHWYEAARALGYGGLKDKAVLKLNEHLKSSNQGQQSKAKYALERLGLLGQ